MYTQEQVDEKIVQRDQLWKEAVGDTFANRQKPSSIIRAEVDVWNNTEIAKVTGFKLRIED